MKKVALTENELINSIQIGGKKREQAIDSIYLDTALKSSIMNFVQSKGGNRQDGEDIFQESIILLDRKIRQNTFAKEAKLKGFLFNTGRYLWMNRLKKNARTQLPGDNEPFNELVNLNPEVRLINEEEKRILQRILNSLGEKCRRILEMWHLSYSMEEIANEMNYSSSSLARKYRYRCHQSLLKFLDDHPEFMNLLKK